MFSSTEIVQFQINFNYHLPDSIRRGLPQKTLHCSLKLPTSSSLKMPASSVWTNLQRNTLFKKACFPPFLNAAHHSPPRQNMFNMALNYQYDLAKQSWDQPLPLKVCSDTIYVFLFFILVPYNLHFLNVWHLPWTTC